MSGKDQPRPGRGGAADAIGKFSAVETTPAAASPQALRGDARFRRLVRHLHRLGPRPVGELLLEFADAYGIEGDILARLEKLAELDPAAASCTPTVRHWRQLMVLSGLLYRGGQP
jgi:hypothetical protein